LRLVNRKRKGENQAKKRSEKKRWKLNRKKTNLPQSVWLKTAKSHEKKFWKEWSWVSPVSP
jgi:hypothetical protein